MMHIQGGYRSGSQMWNCETRASAQGTYITKSSARAQTYLYRTDYQTSSSFLYFYFFEYCSSLMALISRQRALLLALAVIISFWISFVFGGHQADFNDWHYHYHVMSYGLNRPEKHDQFSTTPQRFESSRGKWVINQQRFFYPEGQRYE